MLLVSKYENKVPDPLLLCQACALPASVGEDQDLCVCRDTLPKKLFKVNLMYCTRCLMSSLMRLVSDQLIEHSLCLG